MSSEVKVLPGFSTPSNGFACFCDGKVSWGCVLAKDSRAKDVFSGVELWQSLAWKCSAVSRQCNDLSCDGDVKFCFGLAKFRRVKQWLRVVAICRGFLL